MTVLLTSARCFAACGWLVVAIQLNPASNLVPACSGIPGSVISYSQPAGHLFSSLVVSNPFGQRSAASFAFLTVSLILLLSVSLAVSIHFTILLAYACPTVTFCFLRPPMWISDRAQSSTSFQVFSVSTEASILVFPSQGLP